MNSQIEGDERGEECQQKDFRFLFNFHFLFYFYATANQSICLFNLNASRGSDARHSLFFLSLDFNFFTNRCFLMYFFVYRILIFFWLSSYFAKYFFLLHKNFLSLLLYAIFAFFSFFKIIVCVLF